MHTRSFMPSPRVSNILIAVGFAALGYALYVRYQLVENSTVSAACEASLATSQCLVRQSAVFLFRNQIFGIVALSVALMHFLRPNVYAFAVALAAAAMGLVLYNSDLSAFAVALLVVSFARPVIVDTPPTEPAKEPRTIPPASSTAFR